MRVSSYFVSKNLTGIGPDVIVLPLIFWLVYYGLCLPGLPFFASITVLILVSFACSGMGYACALLFKNDTNSLLAATILPLIFGAINGVDPSIRSMREENSIMQYVVSLSFGRWATEAILVKGYLELAPHQREVGAEVMTNLGFGHDEAAFEFAASMLVVLGFGFRLVAWLLIKWELIMEDPADLTWRRCVRMFECIFLCKRYSQSEEETTVNSLKDVLRQQTKSPSFVERIELKINP